MALGGLYTRLPLLILLHAGYSVKLKKIGSMLTIRNLPTRSFSEHYKIFMQSWISFNKFDTRKVLPMSHSLLEQ